MHTFQSSLSLERDADFLALQRHARRSILRRSRALIGVVLHECNRFTRRHSTYFFEARIAAEYGGDVVLAV